MAAMNVSETSVGEISNRKTRLPQWQRGIVKWVGRAYLEAVNRPRALGPPQDLSPVPVEGDVIFRRWH